MIPTEINKIKQLEKIIRITLEKLRDGRIREEQFSNFLEKFGWKHISTTAEGYYYFRQKDFVSEIPFGLMFGFGVYDKLNGKWFLHLDLDGKFVGGGNEIRSLDSAIIAVLLPFVLEMIGLTKVRQGHGRYGPLLICKDRQEREFLIWYSAGNFYVGFSQEAEHIPIDSCADIAKFLMIGIDKYRKVEKQYLKELHSKLKKPPIVIATSKKNVFLSRNDKFVKFVTILEAKTSHALKVLKSSVIKWDVDNFRSVKAKDCMVIRFGTSKVTSLFEKVVVFYWLIENSEKFEITKSDLDSEEYEVVFTYKGQRYLLEKLGSENYLIDGTSRVQINSLSHLLLLLGERKNG